MGVAAIYPHKTIWGLASNGLNLVHDDSETCLPHLQKQRMRQLLPLPGRPQEPVEDYSDQGAIVMGFCGSCQQKAVSSRTPAPLFQIKRGFRARWNAIDFSVEADSGQWTLRVENSINRETLYTAHR